MTKRYYKIEFKVLEPLSIGSGENRYSDQDLLRNKKGDPFFPATSLAGIYRTLFSEDDVKKYFGYVQIAGKDQNNQNGITMTESKVNVYDGVLKAGTKYNIAIRDGVGLDEYKVAKDSAKFDFEMLEPGATFVTYIEQTKADKDDLDVGAVIAKAFLKKQIYIGRKTMRGYGKIGAEVDKIWYREFDLSKQGSDEDGLEKWIAFDMYAEDAFSNVFEEQSESVEVVSNAVNLTLKLRLKDGISVRKYTTDLAENVGDSQPDYTQMSYVREGEEERVPCIPGTSWAGAFRHQMESFFQDQEKKNAFMHELFGMKYGETEMKKSKIRFSESEITEGQWKTYTRNAIDRFTGGTIDGALYTEEFYRGGKTTLTITVDKSIKMKDVDWKLLLAAAISDLNYGFLAVGGLTSIGRGLFEVISCECDGNGIYSEEKNKKDELYNIVVKELNSDQAETEN